jgi:hypothetical protein
VNHACTLLSEAIEQHRISHTTNVFKSVYFLRQSQTACVRSIMYDMTGRCSSRDDSRENHVTLGLESPASN